MLQSVKQQSHLMASYAMQFVGATVHTAAGPSACRSQQTADRQPADKPPCPR